MPAVTALLPSQRREAPQRCVLMRTVIGRTANPPQPEESNWNVSGSRELGLSKCGAGRLKGRSELADSAIWMSCPIGAVQCERPLDLLLSAQ